jgi:hypothetical protein
MSREHSMEYEHEVLLMLDCEFDIEPYSPGGRDEAPSGGCARLYKVRIGGKEIPGELWAAIGLDAKTVEKINEQAYERACEDARDAADAAGDAKYHMLKDEGRI